MSQPSRYEITHDDALIDAIAAILRTASPSLGRECSCYLATVSAAYVAGRLTASGFLIMRKEQTPGLDL